MRVAGLDSNGDWRFGNGKASYLTRSAAIRQKTMTRLRSFTEDWFLDTQAGGRWLQLEGLPKNDDKLLREIERVVLATTGVMAIDTLRIVRVDAQRTAAIELTVVDIYDQKFTETVNLP